MRTDVIPPILWFGNETFTEGVRAWDLEFVQHSCSGTHIQSLEAESVSAEVVDNIANPTRKRERMSSRGEEIYTLARSSTQRGRSLGS